ncbi:MAG TPA: glycosyltransferase family 39 protein [Zeimonas sp.]|nr:glycosyltransferase family 39 protein [Zeimonas sp.]
MNRTPGSTPGNAAPSARQLLWLMLLYFGAHLASRVLVSDALELDEAEQALWTQGLAPGYGAQPPLYTWLQWGVFQLAGVSVFSLALLKNVLLALTYVFTWLAALRTMPAQLALLASAGMLLIPHIGWESQRDLTHSVLVTAVASATVFVTVQLIERPRPALYVWLGVVAGLGMLSKYSYALFFAALALAVLATREARPVARSPWLVVAGLVALLVVAPHAWWLLDHWQMASDRTLAKMDARPGAWAGLLRGLGSLANAVAGTLVVFALAVGAVFGRDAWRRAGATTRPRNVHCRFWLNYLIALAVLLSAMVAFGGVTNVKGRWLQPLLCMAPLIWFGCRCDLAGHRRLPMFRRVLVAVGLVFLVLLTLRPAFDGWRGRPGDLNQPAGTLAHALQAEGYDGSGAIVAADRVMAGVLRTQFTQARVEVWPLGAAPPALAGEGALLMIARGEDAGWLREQAAVLGLDAGGAVAGEFQLPYAHARAGQPKARYRFVLARSR